MKARCALIAAGLVLGACSSDKPAAHQAAPPQRAGSKEVPPICPLTGLKPAEGVGLARPAVAVKIENSPDARPQSGLDKADLVFEEIVEGGITRFMAIFDCGSSGKAGPVRSARFDDPKFASPFTKVLAYSGSNKIVDRELKKRHMVLLDELTGGNAFFRDPPGDTSTTHNLYVHTEKLRAVARKKNVKAPRADLFHFGDVNGNAKKAHSVTLNFNPSDTIEYRWSKGAWQRYEQGAPFMLTDGKQMSTPNLLVQEVKVDNSETIVDVAGNASPDIHFAGKGKAFLFRDGKVVKATWKVGESGIPRFTASDGKPLQLATGGIIIELLPNKKGQVKGSLSYR